MSHSGCWHSLITGAVRPRLHLSSYRKSRQWPTNIDTCHSQGQGSRQLSTTERMLAGQRLNSTRLKSQELQEYEPSEELADDDEAPQGRRPAAAARLPDMPFQRTGSTASRSQSFDMGQRKMSGQLGTKMARRSALEVATLRKVSQNAAS